MPTPGTSTIAGSAPRIGRAVRRRVPGVVGRVLGAVLLVQLLQPRDDVLDRGVRRQVDDQRADLGAQEVVGAGRAQRRQPRVLARARKSRTTSASVKWPTCGLSVLASPRITGARAAALSRRSASDSASNPGSDGAERLGRPRSARKRSAVRMISSELASHSLAGLAPGGDAVAAEDAADRLRVLLRDRGDVQAELEAGPAPRHPDDAVAEALAGQLPRRRPPSPGRCRSRGAGGRRARP